jgi:hypothetical protein
LIRDQTNPFSGKRFEILIRKHVDPELHGGVRVGGNQSEKQEQASEHDPLGAREKSAVKRYQTLAHKTFRSAFRAAPSESLAGQRAHEPFQLKHRQRTADFISRQARRRGEFVQRKFSHFQGRHEQRFLLR